MQGSRGIFLGNPICSASLEELKEQVYREKPWLRQEDASKVTPRLLLAAAQRAANTEARLVREALVRARKAARVAHAAAGEQELRRERAGDVGASVLSDSARAKTSTTARTVDGRVTAAANLAEYAAGRSQQRAAATEQAVFFFWDAERHVQADSCPEYLFFRSSSWSGRTFPQCASEVHKAKDLTPQSKTNFPAFFTMFPGRPFLFLRCSMMRYRVLHSFFYIGNAFQTSEKDRRLLPPGNRGGQ